MLAQLVILMAVLFVAPAWAVNKCTQSDGRVVFQDAPCATGKAESLTVRPASGSGKALEKSSSAGGTADVESSSPVARPMTEAQKIEKRIAESQKARRLVELEARLVPDSQNAIYRHRQQCDGDMAALQAKKARANNNLAGATWETSISGEMTALATRCDTRNRELRDDADRVREECRSLGGCR